MPDNGQITIKGFQIQDEPKMYLATIPGDWLIEHADPRWRVNDPIAGFQRIINQERAKCIAVAVLDLHRTFPNAIVLATDKLSFNKTDLQLEIPSDTRFFVVDGQHRLWAQKYSDYIVEVDNGTCGHQRLRVRCIGTNGEPTVKGGSHEQFWAIFYNTAAQIKPVILPEYRIALEPIQNSSSWLIEKRNQVNYDSYNGICSVVNFGNNFNATQFPQSLPGDLNVQFKTLKTLLNAVRHYAKEFGLSTDALYNIQNGCNWDNIINNHICLMTPPDISITY
ncbi:hypothetical protein B1772_04590 [Dehalococcoides mccartyi]|jgi:hypothetical protein|uniref:DNA sulfur modification protein DndB n=1 Tax=Dehalococcoides mccartyi TaxID=61435 RepID=UPI00098FAFC1|nr:DNA sulfur modification protein DndB [Dehalococcoides mccartyi]AQU06077.1 hypothetical protein B1777_05180 [Dehalococcoides mccartyi]AQU07521.1 hypothetical protein B1778_04985 [Dehalococcoides mccartyi]AQX74768.1 hypothetical protein B1776_04280 [Dehalococcoides mccartyi]AQY73345.1 hypothetical protein B1772_04590 [Dehalococcoides mccartyi]